MSRGRIILLWIGLLVGGSLPRGLVAQAPSVDYRFENGMVIALIDNSLSAATVDSLLQLIGSSKPETDSLAELGVPLRNAQGWKLVSCTDTQIEYKKPLKELRGVASLRNNTRWTLDLDLDAPPTWAAGTNFGVNRFVAKSVQALESGVRFQLFGFENAKEVHLAGTFNQWSVLATPMKKSSKGWMVTLDLPPGQHLYKFVVDGKWYLDPVNAQVKTDYVGNQNSVYFLPNHTFVLDAYPEAREVVLAGSFNNWEESSLKMKRRGNRWELPVYLADGAHQYKYIVDGTWIVDPAHNNTVPNELGTKNSVLVLGASFEFQFAGVPQAESVCVRGDFNQWRSDSDCLARSDQGWSLPYALPPGNYVYQLLVDGAAQPDPANPHRTKSAEGVASVLSVNPNYSFELKGYPKAKSVALVGNFNGWEKYGGYRMQKVGDVWRISVYLPPGKNTYKFIVDGKWISDKANSLWEKNEFGSRNSVLWVQ